MGIIRAAVNAARGSLADQWLDVVEPMNMSDHILFTRGVKTDRGKKKNKDTSTIITDGSVVHVRENTMMLLVDGGGIIDYSAEPGYYTVSNNAAPSLLNGDLDDAINETFTRFKFGGTTPQKQEVFYINLGELKGLKFGTTSPIQYYDDFYNAEMFLRMHGTYSVKISDPLLFYRNVVSKSADTYGIRDFGEQYQQEFLVALSSTVSKFSVEGERVSFLGAKSAELSAMMKELLAEKWHELRGIDVVSVAIGNFSYDDKSQKIINARNSGASLSGAVKALFGGTQGNQALKKAKENAKLVKETSKLDKLISKTGVKWTCTKCKTKNTGKFCSNCAEKAPPSSDREFKPCNACGTDVDITDTIPKFCPECGDQFVPA